MLVNEVIDYLDGLRASLAFNHAVLDGDGEIVRTAPLLINSIGKVTESFSD